MTYTISTPFLSGSVDAMFSKSHLHRLMIAAALYGSDTEIFYRGGQSEDITATLQCLRALQCQIDDSEPSKLRIRGIGTVCPQEIHRLFCKESGSTLRFLLPVVCALGIPAEFYPEGRLPRRPLSPLREELIGHGCEIAEPGAVPLTVRGRLNGGIFEITGGVSSQYITGLMLALPLLKTESEIRIIGKLESRPYVDMTRDVLDRFGVQIAESGSSIIICPAARQAGKQIFYADGDWSNAAFWLTAGAIGTGKICVTGLSLSSKQGDKAILDLLKRFGAAAQITQTKNGLCDITVFPSKLHGIEIDAADIPDLVPILSLAAAAAEGTTVIRGAGRLRLKESDRLQAVSEVLGSLGADIRQTDDGLIINGTRKYQGFPLQGGTVSSFNDHRIAMTAGIAGTVSRDPVTILQAEAVNKSYPNFWNDYNILNRK